MTYYMLSVHTTSREPRPTTSDEEMRRGYQQILDLEQEMRSAGAFVFGGRLEGPERAKVVRPSKLRVRMTDGPFAETKEHLGGFYLIQAPDLDAALEWASKVTAVIETPIEVRPLAGEPTR